MLEPQGFGSQRNFLVERERAKHRLSDLAPIKANGRFNKAGKMSIIAKVL